MFLESYCHPFEEIAFARFFGPVKFIQALVEADPRGTKHLLVVDLGLWGPFIKYFRVNRLVFLGKWSPGKTHKL